jgi:energy-coupling factor transporter transmembrane protein EcfT
MKSLNPACKFFGVLLASLALAFFYRPELNLAVFAACAAASLLTVRPPRLVLLPLAPAVLIAAGLFVAASQYPGDLSSLGIGAQGGLFSGTRFFNGLTLASRVLAFAGLGLLFVLTTDKIDFVRSLNRQLRLPDPIAYGLIAAWGMLPRLREEYARTRAAFRARGLRAGLASPALLVPLLVKSVRWSEALAAAMESKGFGDSGRRSAYREPKVGAADLAFPILLCAAIILAGLALSRL